MSLTALFAAGNRNRRIIVESQDSWRHFDCGWSSLKWQNERWHKTAAIRPLTTALRSMIQILSIKLLFPLESSGFASLAPKVKVFIHCWLFGRRKSWIMNDSRSLNSINTPEPWNRVQLLFSEIDTWGNEMKMIFFVFGSKAYKGRFGKITLVCRGK